ncbi:MAG: nucleotide excision repair endonuclease [Deltaproteobacteria bacterium]|nr:nucleotide excision repair endonuclease [Deltaproteobacteria bacterium]
MLDERSDARVLDFLATRPEGVEPEELGRELLALSGPAALIARVSAGVATAVAGVVQGRDGRLRLAEAGGGAGDGAVRLAVSARLVPPGEVVEIAVAVLGERGPSAVPWQVVVAPRAALDEAAFMALRLDGRRLACAEPREVVARALAARVAGTSVIVWDEREAAAVRALLGEAGADGDAPSEPPRQILALRPRLAARAKLPGGTIRDAAMVLGLPVPLTTDLATAVRTLALAAEAARERAWDGPPPAAEGFDFARTALSPASLAALPDAPGIYRLLARDGRPLYVGKAKCLRGRVASYFAPGGDGRRLHGELMREVHDLEIEETGSELLALLREAEEIARLSPPFNVVRQVRRTSAREGRLAILVPGPEDAVHALLVRDAALVAQVDVDDGAALAIALGRLAGGVGGDASEAASRIAATWLDRAVDGAGSAIVDLDDAADAAAMVERVRAARRDPELFTERIVLR